MNDLILVNYDRAIPTVSGRLLKERLEVGTRYNDWFPRMCEYGFTEGIDYYSNLSNGAGFGKAATRADHDLTIPMAKEIAMLQRTDKGKRVRRYFIELEEAWNSPEQIMIRALKIADEKLNALKARTFVLEEKNETLEIALNESLKFYTVAKYNKEHKMRWSMPKCQEIGKKLSAHCRANSIEIRKCETNDERFGMTNSYPTTAWDSFLNKHTNTK